MSARIATERVYRTLDGRYVPHGHEDAAFLVVGVGGPLPADFESFDPTVAIGADDDEPEPVADDDEPDDQADEPEVADEPVAPKKPPAKTKKA